MPQTNTNTNLMKQPRIFLFPWNQQSESAKALTQALEGKLILREGSKFKPSDHKKVVNWGASDCPYDCMNNPVSVKAVSNKLIWFRHLENLRKEFPSASLPRVPDWTVEKAEAEGWKSSDKVVCRTVLNGHGGDGITIVDDGQELVDAPLYVKYIPKDSEYRVHVFNGEVIDVQRKVRDPDKEPTDWSVRNHDNGFIFTRQNSEGVSYMDAAPKDVLEQSKRALGCSGLVFGAVDTLWNRNRGHAYVLEVNSAPGLEGDSITIYRDAIRKYYNVQ